MKQTIKTNKLIDKKTLVEVDIVKQPVYLNGAVPIAFLETTRTSVLKLI